MYYNESNHFMYHTSLSSSEINFYTTGTCMVMNTYTTSGGPRPLGKRAASIYLWGDAIYPMDYTINLHRANCIYGIPHTTPPAN